MTASARVQHLIKTHLPNFSMAQGFYSDPVVFQEDLSKIFYRNWLYVGSGREIPKQGEYFTREIGDDSIIVLRNEDQQICAFYNTCRHRGSRICLEEKGKVGQVLICPYHKWTYDLSGALVRCHLMGDDFDRSPYRLATVRTEVVCDQIFICLGEEYPDFTPCRQAFEPHLMPYQLEHTKIAHKQTYWVKANWKLIVENNRECFHCLPNHPEFMQSNYDLGVNLDTRIDEDYQERILEQTAKWESQKLCTDTVNFPGDGWFRIARMVLKPDYVTESLDGKPVAPILGELQDHDAGSLRVITLPNSWHHFNSDYALSGYLFPENEHLTRVLVHYLVHEDAEEGEDYQRDRVTTVWQETLKQDWKLCEGNNAGILSSCYEPGPYSSVMENAVEEFIDWYFMQLSV